MVRVRIIGNGHGYRYDFSSKVSTDSASGRPRELFLMDPTG
jgi:hypothetical protein